MPKRTKVLPYVFDFTVRYGLRFGEVYTTSSNLEAIAIWRHSEKAGVSFWRLLRVGVAPTAFVSLGKGFWRLLQYDKYISELRRRHLPSRHRYLYLLAVAPEFQGKGCASTLMRPRPAQVQQGHLPCYLETQEEKNVRIYEHYGFSVLQETTIPGIGVPNWAMLNAI